MLAAPVLFALGVATSYAPLLRVDPRESVLVPERELPVSARRAMRADVLFATWLVGRHARTLASRPERLLDTEHCAPARHTIALGPPMLTLGALALPVWLLSSDPIAAFNSAVFLVPWLGALAVFLLVADWTRLPAAGALAGILYGLSPIVLADVVHPFVHDMAWTAFALFFARRLLAGGRWRDAFGLAFSIAAQLGADAYPALAALFLAPPLMLWLLLHYRLQRVRPAQLLLVAALVAAAASWILTPYAELRMATPSLRRDAQLFVPVSAFLPGGARFPGLVAVALAACAPFVARGRSLAGLDGDPRPALCAALALVALAATGPLYRAVAPLLPFADAVRVIGHVAIGVQLLVCVLAGIGAAGLLRMLPQRARSAAGVALVGAVFVATLRPPWLGFEPRLSLGTIRARPDPASLRLAEELARAGAGGALAELPVIALRGEREVRRILLSSWHGRRTSACFGSYTPPEHDRLRRIAAALPGPGAVRELRRLGFTSLLVHRGRLPLEERFARQARRANPPLRVLREGEDFTLFELREVPGSRVVESPGP